MTSDLSKLESIISYQFKNRNLLREALTHRSYLNENPNWDVPHNERLEFLGDAVAELSVSEYLFKNYPHKSEGELTSYRAALVNYQFMSKIASAINL
ncbi:MAG: ribonuclease III, partial [Parcubacteria group bacterium]|nr:ribonuclease III [Parcubacteria group bacterium]